MSTMIELSTSLARIIKYPSGIIAPGRMLQRGNPALVGFLISAAYQSRLFPFRRLRSSGDGGVSYRRLACLRIQYVPHSLNPTIGRPKTDISLGFVLSGRGTF